MISFPAFCEKRTRGGSPVPSTWTLNTNHNISDYINEVFYGSDGYWVIAGENSAGNGVIDYRQTNPTGTFTAATSGFSTSDVRALNYDGSTYWTAGGYDGKFRYKASPPSGTWSDGVIIPGSTNIYGQGYGNGYWVVGGYGTPAKLAYSSVTV